MIPRAANNEKSFLFYVTQDSPEIWRVAPINGDSVDIQQGVITNAEVPRGILRENNGLEYFESVISAHMKK